MTHTEESLMALADRMYSAPAGTLKNMIEIELRLAISEVLAERDRYLDIIRREAWLEHAAENDVASPYVPFTDWVAEKNRAEKAEAEVERLREDLRGLEEVRREQAAGRDYWSAECERLRKDAARYRRLQILGVAPGGSRYLDNGTVLRFTNLDKYVDNDIAAHPSRGESTIEQAKCMTPTAADIEDAKDCMIDPALYPGTVRDLLLRFVLREKP